METNGTAPQRVLTKSSQDLNGLQFNAANKQNKPKTDNNVKPQVQKRVSPPASRTTLSPRPAEDEERAQYVSSFGHPSPGTIIRQQSSARLAKGDNTPPNSVAATTRPGSEAGSHVSTRDNASVRSWASVGMGSTDGKKMIIRRVPTTPVELFNIVNPPT